jgi:hypothetical protein
MRAIGSDTRFMRRASRRILGALLAPLLALGCGSKERPGVAPDGAPPDPDAAVPPDTAPLRPEIPPLRNPVGLPDAELAVAALTILGANVALAAASCNQCHSLTRQQLRTWRGLSDVARSACLTDLDVASQASARKMIDCLRAMPEIPGSDFQTPKLGIYAAATHLGWFDATARYAYAPSGGAMAASELVAAAGMPRSGTAAVPFTQAQFDVVAEWFARGLPQLEQTLPQDPAPTTCAASVSAEVAAHVTAMKTQGWQALNKTALMAMYGCGAGDDPAQCLPAAPLAADQPYGAGWDLPERGRLRVLAEEAYRSSFWSRSSPDGRFVGHGVQDVTGSYIIDLQRDGALIPIDAQYDPNWFPDNSGFVFQGGPGGRNTCAQSVLTSNPEKILMAGEPGCQSLSTVGLYEHVGAVDGGDHFAIDSRFVSDDGGHGATLRDPSATFSQTASMGFTPLVYDGAKYTPKPEVAIPSPFEGDAVISPSARLVITRVAGPGDKQLGYVLRKVVATPAGASYTIQAPEVARYCRSGGKPAFSYDERWLVYHHYVTATDADAVELGFVNAADPGFAPYRTRGAANLYLLELAGGTSVRITNMKPGQYALFPHFRSDGWIYAVIRDQTGAAYAEHVVASDAALIAP